MLRQNVRRRLGLQLRCRKFGSTSTEEILQGPLATRLQAEAPIPQSHRALIAGGLEEKHAHSVGR